MLIIRGLRALLWSALALAATIPQSPPSSLPARDELDVRSGPDHQYRLPRTSRRTHRRGSRGTEEARFENGWTPKRLRPRQDERCSESTFCDDGAGSFQCCGAGFRCCVADDGSGSCCPAGCEGEDCPPDSNPSEAVIVPTVVSTITIIRTVTEGSITVTEVVTSTVSQTITLLDAALSTQTDIVTVTAASAARRRLRRTEIPVTKTGGGSGVSPSVETQLTAAAEGVEDGANASDVSTSRATTNVNVEAEAADVVTVTTTVELVTTTTGVVTVTSTFYNTIFVTLILAPSASTTVFVTTTVQPSPGSSPSSLPGGSNPPQDDDLGAENPTVIPSGAFTSSSGTSPQPPSGSSSTATVTDTRLPTGVTDTIPTGTPHTQPDTRQSMHPSPSPSPTSDPVQPISGSPLTSDEIAGIALGIIFSLLLLVLAAFFIHHLIKKRQDASLTRSHHDISTSTASSGSIFVGAGSSILSRDSGRARLVRPAPVLGSGALGPAPSDGSSAETTPREGEVRIVIRPAPRRRTQSSGLFPRPGREPRSSGLGTTGGSQRSPRDQWPRPPGYSGQTYSFFVEDSGATTPLDAGQWSVASEHGSRGDGSGSADRGPSSGDRGSGSGGGGGGGGGGYLSVGRALSPWKAI